MSNIMIGSARVDENGKYAGGAAGDQKQTSSTNDTAGEVSIQTIYNHSKGWLVFRPKSEVHAGLIGCKMTTACNNKNIGYDQNQRLGIITYGVDTKTATECDCSSLVRECVKEATGTDPGNFTTETEPKMLKATGLFEEPFVYVSQAKTPVYNGDILVTKTKGHTAIVVSGNPRKSTTAAAQTSNTSSGYKVGDVVQFTGTKHYTSANAASGKDCKAGKAKVTQVYASGKHPYHLVAVDGGGSTVYGWVNASDISTAAGAATTASNTYTVAKGDSLWSIAAKKLGNGNRYTEIKKLNGLTSDTIYAGQVLKLPN